MDKILAVITKEFQRIMKFYCLLPPCIKYDPSYKQKIK